MRWMVRIVGIPVALGLVAVSMLMNYRFGIRLGAEEGDSWAYGIASICADGLKVILPFVCAWAWSGRKIVAWLGAALLWVVLTAYALVSALSFAAVNRAEIHGRYASAAETHGDLRADLVRKRQQREALPTFRASAAVAGDIRAAEQNVRWTNSNRCTDATARETRAFCDSYFRLTAELGAAKQAESVDAEITALRQRLDRLPQTAGHRPLDPQVELFRELSGFAEGKIKLALAILVCLLVELGSGLGLYLVLAYERAATGRPVNAATPVSEPMPVIEITSVNDEVWMQERLVRDPAGRIGAAELYADYRLWVDRQGRDSAMTVTAFGRWLGDNGFAKSKHGGRIVYEGVRIKRTVPVLAAS